MSPPPGTKVDLEDLAVRLAGCGPVEKNRFLVRAHVEEFALTVFADGRAIVTGTTQPERARAVYARYVGA